MKNNFKTFLLKEIEGDPTLSDTFHGKTKIRIFNRLSSRKVPESWTKIHFKVYPRLKRIKLSNLEKTSPLSTILKDRRSVREFSQQPMKKDDISYILFNCAGIIKIDKNIDQSRRPYPSAGARYPLEIYPIIINCSGIQSGLYHYNVLERSLEELELGDYTKHIMSFTGENWPARASVLLIITGVLNRCRVKYKDRGYRYILYEAGHVGQNISLLSTELHLGCCAIGGFIDDQVSKILDIDKETEVPLYMFAIGHNEIHKI